MKPVLLLIALLLAAALPAGAAGPLLYQGEQTLWQDTVWDGEVTIDGILTVAPGVTLEIRPGTTVRFTPYDSNGDGIGEHELFCQGTLRALGSLDRPVRFTSAAPAPRRGDWGALNMMTSEAGNLLEHCIIEHAYRGFHAHFAQATLRDCLLRDNVRGAQFQESRVVIERCRLVDNTNGLQFRDSEATLADSLVARNHWGVRCVYSTLVLRDCRIEENLVNGVNARESTLTVTASRITGNRRGLYLQNSHAEVVGNELSGNSEHGIFLEQGEVELRGNRIANNGRAGVRWLEATGLLRDNAIVDNGEYALINDGAGPVEARGNWWGETDPERIAAAIRDGRDRSGMGPVEAAEPLLQPLPGTTPAVTEKSP
ncbi:MAG: right-handed parallel beta-helix repeat-containing protein [Deltaproteobacteria bacterium]|nr:MAG: right-handed parallel beta-helix repeat-containing protein [Deltaproteobacteria bacterium]